MDHDDRFVVWISNGSGFNLGQEWLSEPFNYSAYTFKVGDVNGDGKSDIIAILKNTNRFVVWTSNGSRFNGGQQWLSESFNYSGYDFQVGDINGDGKSDVFAVVKSDERFVVWSSYGNSFSGGEEWMNGPFNYSAYSFNIGDFNGDKKFDIVAILNNNDRFIVYLKK